MQFLASGIMFAQINVMHIDNNAAPQTKDGVFYSLPRTVVKIDVKNRRLGLSLKRVNSPEWLDRDLQRYMSGQ